MTSPRRDAAEIRAKVQQYVAAVMHDEATDAQVAQMEQLLRESDEARQLYADMIELSVQLPRVLAGVLGQTDECGMTKDQWSGESSLGDSSSSMARHSPGSLSPVVIQAFPSSFSSFVGGAVFSYLVAAVIVGLGLIVAGVWKLPNSQELVLRQPASAPVAPSPAVFATEVGRITGMFDCQWADPKTETIDGAHVSLGRKYDLASGLIEITYHGGAKVVLQGPATYEVQSAAGGYLSYGKLTARLEKKVASGQWSVGSGQNSASHPPLATNHSPNPQSLIPTPSFSIRTPTALVTDLGTEFGVDVDKAGATESYVFRGVVRVQALDQGGKTHGEAKVLREMESMRILRDSDGRTSVAATSARPADFVRELPKRTVKVFDLADVVAGGDGFSGRRDQGIDARNGRIVRMLPDDLARRPSVTTPNLLSGRTASASSEYSDIHVAANAVDRLPEESGKTDWVSKEIDSDSNPRLAVSGFNSPIRTIRVWTDADVPVRSIAIRSSTRDQRSLAIADYETSLVERTEYADLTDWTSLGMESVEGSYYRDFDVHAPPGTRSLLFDFGDKGWVRAQEVQAFAQLIGAEDGGGGGPFHRVAKLRLVDGVFVPGATAGPTQIDSTGRTFDGFTASVSHSPFYVWAMGKPLGYSPRTLLDGVDYAAPGHGLLYMPANKGITFDLDAIRRANTGWRPLRFRAVGGNAEPGDEKPVPGVEKASRVSADLWVLVDGRLRFRRRDINGYSGIVPIILSLGPNDRFLTLAATDADNGVVRDWIVFGDPVLDLVQDSNGVGRQSKP